MLISTTEALIFEPCSTMTKNFAEAISLKFKDEDLGCRIDEVLETGSGKEEVVSATTKASGKKYYLLLIFKYLLIYQPNKKTKKKCVKYYLFVNKLSLILYY